MIMIAIKNMTFHNVDVLESLVVNIHILLLKKTFTWKGLKSKTSTNQLLLLGEKKRKELININIIINPIEGLFLL